MSTVTALSRVAALVLLAALLAGCGEGGAQPSPTRTPSPSRTLTAKATATPVTPVVCAPALPHASGHFNESVASGGLTRTYIVHVPAGYDGATRAPVVLLFHGFALGADFMELYTGIADAADAGGFIAVIPNGQGSPSFWNTGMPGAADDVAFVRDLLAKLDGELCVDPARVYAAGFSNGGGMAQLLSCDMPDRIAAVAVVASTHLTCTPHTPVVAFHGDSDPVQRFDGGVGIDVGEPPGVTGTPAPVRTRLADWAAALGCDATPTASHPGPDVDLSTFSRCSGGGADVLLYVIVGGGHTWPGGTASLGATTRTISATSLMWEFFAAHPR